jgi:hypothetical protein
VLDRILRSRRCICLAGAVPGTLGTGRYIPACPCLCPARLKPGRNAITMRPRTGIQQGAQVARIHSKTCHDALHGNGQHSCSHRDCLWSRSGDVYAGYCSWLVSGRRRGRRAGTRPRPAAATHPVQLCQRGLAHHRSCPRRVTVRGYGSAPESVARLLSYSLQHVVLEPVTRPLGEAAQVCDIFGVGIGLLTGCHPLALASAKLLAKSETHKQMARGVLRAGNRVFHGELPWPEPGELSASEESSREAEGRVSRGARFVGRPLGALNPGRSRATPGWDGRLAVEGSRDPGQVREPHRMAAAVRAHMSNAKSRPRCGNLTAWRLAASGICGRSWPSTRRTTTGGGPSQPAPLPASTRLPTSRTSPRSGSSAVLSSAVSSTSTSELDKSPGRNRWPSYATP